jgi:hypothetical protein
MNSVESPKESEIRPLADNKSTVELSAPVLLPPDTFERDLAEIQSLLGTMEEHWKTTPEPRQESDKWRHDLQEFGGMIK